MFFKKKSKLKATEAKIIAQIAQVKRRAKEEEQILRLILLDAKAGLFSRYFRVIFEHHQLMLKDLGYILKEDEIEDWDYSRSTPTKAWYKAVKVSWE